MAFTSIGDKQHLYWRRLTLVHVISYASTSVSLRQYKRKFTPVQAQVHASTSISSRQYKCKRLAMGV